MSHSPQWPDQRPDQPAQSPGSDAPLSHLARLARSRRGLTTLTIVTGVLIVALLGMLALTLSSNAHGAQAQNGQGASADGAQTVTAGGGGNGASSGGSTPTPGGGSSGGDGTHPTPTPSRGSATPTPTSGVITGCCLTFSPYVHQVVSQASLPGASVGPVVATCPSGEIALSGGWAVAYNSGATIYSSERIAGGSWGIYVRHSSSVGVTTYAECLANASGATIAERAAYTSVSPDSIGGTTASCIAGEVLVGGGFAFQNGLHLYYFAASSSTQWEGYANNRGDSSANMNVYAECLTDVHAHSSHTADQYAPSLAEGGRGGVTSKACPSGAYVSGGSFNYYTDAGFEDSAFSYAVWASGNNTTWTVDLFYVNGGGNAHFNSQAMCLGF